MNKTPATPVALIPGGGWRAEYRDDDGSLWSTPIVGWVLTTEGRVSPVSTDCYGCHDDPTGPGNFVRIYHPDATGPGPSPTREEF